MREWDKGSGWEKVSLAGWEVAPSAPNTRPAPRTHAGSPSQAAIANQPIGIGVRGGGCGFFLLKLGLEAFPHDQGDRTPRSSPKVPSYHYLAGLALCLGPLRTRIINASLLRSQQVTRSQHGLREQQTATSPGCKTQGKSKTSRRHTGVCRRCFDH